MNRKKVVSLLMAFMLFVGSAVQPVQAATINTAKKKEQVLKERKEKIKKEQLSLKEKLNTIIAEMEKTQADVVAKEDELAIAEDELIAARIKQNEQYERMKIRIKYMYENGDTEMLEVLLTAESMGDFLNKAEYVQQVSEYDRKMLQEFQKLVEEVGAKEALLQKEKEELIVLQEKLEKNQKAVNELISSKNAEASELDAEISKNSKILKKLLADAAESERKKQEAANSGNSGGGKPKPPVVSGNGFLSNPCPAAYISSEYGPRKAPVAGASTFHEGRDYAAPSGTPIYAAADGKVVQSGYHSVRGNYVVVDHGGGIVTWYQHCTSIYVKRGQSVSRGQNIATVGATGRVSGPHLHFIVEENGKLVDPRKYL